jgi:late competence protein required for DNA uptake (superfamily II DNA/RNA helicase)
MRCSRCHTPHAQECPLTVVSSILLCPACLQMMEARRDPSSPYGVPPFHPNCRAHASWVAQDFSMVTERSWLASAFDEATEQLFARLRAGKVPGREEHAP